MEFQFEGPTRSFACSLSPRPCAHVHPTTKAQCARVQYIGSGLCWQHLAIDRSLKVAPTSIPGAEGKGLFAFSRTPGEVLFRPGDRIIEYDAEHIDRREADARYGRSTAPYGVAHSEASVENGACVRGPGTLANTHPGHNNATLVTPGRRRGGHGTAWLKATRRIRSGEEIALAYGRAYRLGEPGVTHRTRRTRGPYRAYQRAVAK